MSIATNLRRLMDGGTLRLHGCRNAWMRICAGNLPERWRQRIGENELSGIRFAEDGLVHPAVPQGKPAPGRKDLWTDATYRDAHVCLTCTADECEGEADCFRRRKKLLEARKK